MNLKEQRQKVYEDIYATASQAGMKAAQGTTTIPMAVKEGGRTIEVVDEGACGFGWAVLKPGTHPFCRWLVASKLGRKHYQGGVAVYSGWPGQSVDRNEAYARGFAEVINQVLGGKDAEGKEGVTARAESRLD